VYDGADTSCSVGTALSAILPSTSASTVASGVTLAAGASRTYCVKVDFGVNAPLSMQGLTTSVMIAFTASQVVP
jgi:hypothetical protein